MADANYRRLNCASCHVSFSFVQGQGRPRTKCDGCKKQSKGLAAGERDCARCGVTFTAKSGQKYCSYRCKEGTKQTRAEYLSDHSSRGRLLFTCLHCFKEYSRTKSDAQKVEQRGHENKFCSLDCRVASVRHVWKEIELLRSLALKNVNRCVREPRIKPSIRSLARVLKKVAEKKRKSIQPCVVCGEAVGYKFGRPRLTCSDRCSRNTPTSKTAQRAYKSRRKAIERGCKEARAINPIDVLERDGWKCQLCGVKTPKKLRGTYNARAPELDHIVPISLGGTHTWDNLQCLCRGCNGRKSNKSCAGQLGLFTALMT